MRGRWLALACHDIAITKAFPVVSWHNVQVIDKTLGYVAAAHLYGSGTIIIIGNVGWPLLKILEALKHNTVDLGLTIANLRHCDFQRAIMASFMQNLNIYGYKALYRTSDFILSVTELQKGPDMLP